jgi:hypothetical protein
MDRRKFLGLVPTVVVAGLIAPELLIPKESVKLLPLQIYEPKTIRWIDRAEWEFKIQWKIDREREFIMYTDRHGAIDFHEAVKKLAKYYENDNFTSFLNKIGS